MAILNVIFKMLPCKECFECQLTLVDDYSKRMGCASYLSLQCKSCTWTEVFYTSEKVGHYFQVNRRMVYAMRSVGCGLSAMQRFFCSTMNMPPPIGTKPYASHTKTILRPAKDVAESTSNDAAKEIHDLSNQETDEEGIVKAAISCDGTWQRRGFSSLHGRVLDVGPLSKFCNKCKQYMKVVKIRWKVHCGKQNMHLVVNQTTVDLHWPWNQEEPREFLIAQSALTVFNIMNFTEMVIVKVLVQRPTKMSMVWL